MNVEKLAPDMGKAGDFLDPTTTIKILEPGIAVGMQPACKVFKMISRLAASAIRCELVESGWMMIATPIPLIPEIDP